MIYRAFISQRAEFDEAAIYDYLAQYSASTAQRFVDQLAETVLHIRSIAKPGIRWESENPRLAELRWIKVRGFPKHLIFFRIEDETIRVARILHGARDIETILGE